MDRKGVDKITADQHGMITTAQFLAATGSDDALAWAVQTGGLPDIPGGGACTSSLVRR